MLYASIMSGQNAAPQKHTTGYIRTLDGWRAIAVCGVILYHCDQITMGPDAFRRIQAFGGHGVELFFAISGILICSRLLEEQRLHGGISLRGFYLRRIFRIQPAAIVYLAAIGILAVAGTIRPTLPATLSALFCFRNFYAVSNALKSPDDIYTAHFWSLAVEEHFYLLLPVLLLFGRKRLLPLLTMLTAISFLWSHIVYRFYFEEGRPEQWRTDVALQNLLFPALLAVLLTQAPFHRAMVKMTQYNVMIILILGAMIASQVFFKGQLLVPLMASGFPLMVASTMLHPEGWFGRLLGSAPFLFLGRISYSLYLWQQLFFVHETKSSWLGAMQHSPWNFAAVLIFAMASFYLVERPMMRLGHRLAPPATSGRPDL